jgi:HemY protein
MIRVVVFLVVVALLAFGVSWVAERPGEVAVTWHGWRVETSVMVTLVALIAIIVAAMVGWSILRGVVRSPRQLREAMHRRREARGRLAITRGLIAIGAGDADAARKYSQEAQRLASDQPLTLLLCAQAAQLSGDRAAAERTFRAMAGRDDTKLLGLRGLFVEAQRRDDVDAARMFAEEAARTAPALGWSGQAVLQFRSAVGDWVGALDILERNNRSRLIDKATYRRQRAVLLTARAQAAEETNRDEAYAFAVEAVGLAPTLVPAAALAGRLLAEAGELRKASRIIEKAWRSGPHPDLADAYAHLRFGDSARDRLKRMQILTEVVPGHIEGALAVARAAVDAREFAIAREALEPFVGEPTRRVAILMAELEDVERGDVGRAREWMARALRATRDPAWTADGFVSERWRPVSPVSGRLDAFEWKAPLTEIAAPSPPIEARVETASVIEDKPAGAQEVAAPEEPPAAASDAVADAAAAAEAPPSQDIRPPSVGMAAKTVREPPVETVIPLAHVPDDPGPEPEADAESEPAPEPGWRRLRPFSK